MSTLGLIEYKDASPEVRAVYDDIMATRKTDWINNFWKAIAHDPATLKRTWEDIKQIMAPGALDPLTKEMLYIAVSVTNQCGYCIASHTVGAQKKGMTDAMFKELMAVVGMANETNKMVTGISSGDRRAVQAALETAVPQLENGCPNRPQIDSASISKLSND
jgi:AhpD family alkylhydroperoxidase